jgi:hypothetical protein
MSERDRQFLLGHPMYAKCSSGARPTDSEFVDRYNKLQSCMKCDLDSYKGLCSSSSQESCSLDQGCLTKEPGWSDEYAVEMNTLSLHEEALTHHFCKQLKGIKQMKIGIEIFDVVHMKNRMEYLNSLELGRLCNRFGEESYLDDTVLNTYFMWLQSMNHRILDDPSVPEENRLLCGFFSTLAYNKMCSVYLTGQGEYPGVSKRLFDMDRLFFPVGVGQHGASDKHDHWALVMVDVRQHKLWYIDSMVNYVLDKGKMEVCKIIQSYLAWHGMDNLSIEMMKDAPHQPNFYDCGVYVCMYALFLMQNIGLDKIHFRHGRMKILAQLLEGTYPLE